MTQRELINKKVKDNQALLEQYKGLTESADRVTSKRQTTNNFYLTANSFLLAAAGYLTSTNYLVIPLIISIIGISIATLWFYNIHSYKSLNAAKYKVIHELEEYLPARIYQKEDEYLKKEYYQLTSIEKIIPIMFGIFYGIVMYITLY